MTNNEAIEKLETLIDSYYSNDDSESPYIEALQIGIDSIETRDKCISVIRSVSISLRSKDDEIKMLKSILQEAINNGYDGIIQCKDCPHFTFTPNSFDGRCDIRYQHSPYGFCIQPRRR